MKYLLFTLLWIFTITGQAQDNASLLNEPMDWKFERIDFPLDFASEIEYEGYEELRFSSGMFDVKSDEYFTYFFAFNLKHSKILSERELTSLLEKYYSGLANAVAKDKIDNQEQYFSKVIKLNDDKWSIKFRDCFTNCEEIVINVQIKQNASNENLKIFALASPEDFNSPLWEKLRPTLIKLSSEKEEL
ncbi:hypothetical protein [Aureibacter tunicatorum]|uniref:Chalcone isomerase domain-containing protein n=1 Tax=Aureibacter tunicatorum TaxID=866807 RepID=A0AAE3XP20_9BACT|nr:hypothetical protein [Aureibacter tunicatorum]MDR6239429.1 hypothetical protein [Aureibacter tunicatorum]BDD04648.1 hypothetical protein AUTU_21310 [Aureibacter tunicatorum]